RETELHEIMPSHTPHKVVVIGGGPAGLEAARVARLRGHEVVLLEKSGELGGQALIAAKAPARGEFAGATQWLAQQCRKLGVHIRLHCEATVARVMSASPDVVIVATGARPLVPNLPGIASAVDAWSVLNGHLPSRERIAGIDEEARFQGPDHADVVLDTGRRVVLAARLGSFLSQR